jgi:hypothetical protein
MQGAKARDTEQLAKKAAAKVTTAARALRRA